MKSAVFRRQWLLVLVIVIVTFAASFLISRPKVPAKNKIVEESLQQVPVTILKAQTVTMPVLTQGIVEPRTKIRLLSEVNGKVLETSAKWLNGGFFHKGDTLLKIEDYLYQNQLARAQASQAQAKSALVQEQGFSYVARQEWEKRDPQEDNAAARSLALREPQLASMQAQYEAASADVVTAENNLAKTVIKAPFDGVVVNKAVDIGQFVSPGLALAELFAIDVVEIKVPLTEEQQAFLDLPALNRTARIPAEVQHESPQGPVIWQGYLVRTEGVLDPVTKVLNGVVQVQDPYGLNHTVKSPLRLGTFVEMKLQGKRLDNIFVMPRRFLYTGNVVWLVDADDKLRSRTVKTLPIRDEYVYVYEGLKDGERLVSGGVVGLLDGKKVSPVGVTEPGQSAGGQE